MRQASDIERGALVTVTVLTHVEIVAYAMQPDRQQAEAPPAIEPAVN